MRGWNTGKVAAVTLLEAIVAGCTMPSIPYINEDDGPKVVQPCPQTAVLADASKIVRFKAGSDVDLENLVYEGEFQGFRAACRVTPKGIDVELQVLLSLEPGPAGPRGGPEVRYFVAITDVKKNILNRRVLRIDEDLIDSEGFQEIADDPVHMILPTRGGKTVHDYRVYIGFDLSAREVQFNRNSGNIQ